MKYSVMKKWVKALRSGKYKQTTGQLRDYARYDEGKTYCCLGVLCSITKSKGWVGETVLPKHVVKKVGMKLDRGNGEINDEGWYDKGKCLSQLNDNGMSFKQIANVIEKVYKRL